MRRRKTAQKAHTKLGKKKDESEIGENEIGERTHTNKIARTRYETATPSSTNNEKCETGNGVSRVNYKNFFLSLYFQMARSNNRPRERERIGTLSTEQSAEQSAEHY